MHAKHAYTHTYAKHAYTHMYAKHAYIYTHAKHTYTHMCAKHAYTHTHAKHAYMHKHLHIHIKMEKEKSPPDHILWLKSSKALSQGVGPSYGLKGPTRIVRSYIQHCIVRSYIQHTSLAHPKIFSAHSQFSDSAIPADTCTASHSPSTPTSGPTPFCYCSLSRESFCSLPSIFCTNIKSMRPSLTIFIDYGMCVHRWGDG